MRSSLSQLYGCADTRLATDLEPVAVEIPEHVIISVSGWRRYAVSAAVSSLELAQAPIRLLTNDATVASAHPEVENGLPAAYVRALAQAKGLDGDLVPQPPRLQSAAAARAAARVVRTAARASTAPADRVRGVLRTTPTVVRVLGGGVKQDLRALRRAAAAARARRWQAVDIAANPVGRAPQVPPVHLVADVASFPLVSSLLDVQPEARLAVEPDRRLLGLTPVDVP